MEGYPLQYPGLENCMNHIIYGVTKNQTWLSNFHFQGLNILGSYAILFLQHQTLLSPPDTSTTGHHFCFGSASSFLLELFLCFSPVAHWTPTDLGSSSFSVISFCLFILFMGFSRQEYWSVCHSLLQWTMSYENSPPWPVHLGRPYMPWLIVSLSYTKLWSLWSFCFLLFWFSFCMPSDEWG